MGARLRSRQPEELGSPGNKLKKRLHPSKAEFFQAFPSHKNVLIVSLCVPARHSFAFLSKIKQVEIKDNHLASPGYFIPLFGPDLGTHPDTLTWEPGALGSLGN